MAENTKMIDKQIASCEKAIEKYKKSIERYKSIMEKKGAILSKVAPNYNEYTNSWDFGREFGDKYYDIHYSWRNAKDYLEDNEKNLQYELKRLDNLKNQKAEKENNVKEYIDGTQVLVDLFEKHLAEYKINYFNECEKMFGELYIETMKKIPWAKEIKDRAKTELPWIFHQGRTVDRVLDSSDCMYDYKEHRYSYKDWRKGWIPFTDEQMQLIINLRKADNIIRLNCQAFENKDAFVAYRMDAVKMDWDSKIRVFADKCNKFNINTEAVKFNMDETHLKGGGCSFYLTDGGPYRIYGRFIYAAEYSDKVTPHIRFIVTKKNA